MPGLKISKVRSQSVKEEKERGPRRVVEEVQQQKYRCKVVTLPYRQAMSGSTGRQSTVVKSLKRVPVLKRYSKKKGPEEAS